MLSPLTLLDLKNRVMALNKTGVRVMPDLGEMVVFQEMVWERILSLCTPLNLALPYNDEGICKIDIAEECVQWYVKAPVIAKIDSDYIDIDSRLKEAFVFYFIAFLSLQGRDNNRLEWEERAAKVCLDYSCDVANMGMAMAKQVYTYDNSITGVKFDCYGASYMVSDSLVKHIIDCAFCGKTCRSVHEHKQLERYKEYLDYMAKTKAGQSVKISVLPGQVSALRALDIAIFFYLTKHEDLLTAENMDKINEVTTLSIAMCDVLSGKDVPSWVSAVAQRVNALTGVNK